MSSCQAGPRNLITDIIGLRVGNSADDAINTGVTVLICDEPVIASVKVLGGGPGTRDTELLEPENLVENIDAIVLSGGSAFGLDAAGGTQAWLRENNRGFKVGPHLVPIVPSAILFDLQNGGDKNWGRYAPYRDLGFAASENASVDFCLGTQGAGKGALTATCKGGLGSASTIMRFSNGETVTVGALVAVNALGSPVIGDTHHFWSAPFEIEKEFGGFGYPSPIPQSARDIRVKHRNEMQTGTNTTIAIIATDAALSKAQAKRLAIAAHDGFARALWPSHSPLDGDLVFALSTGSAGPPRNLDDQIDLSAIAASTMGRAIARGIHEALPEENDIIPAWAEKFGS